VNKTSRSRTGGGAFWLGLLLGGLVGAMTGLWKAPASGAELRRRLIRRGAAIGSKAGEMVIGERITDVVAEGKAVAQQRQKDLANKVS